MLLQTEQIDVVQKYLSQFINMGIQYAPKLLLALLVLWIGSRIINSIVRVLASALQKRNVDASLTPFLTSILNAIFKTMLFLSVASLVGVETTSFVAILGAAGLAVGLALQGSLSNFAGGVLIMLFKPFKLGDFIEAMGHSGFVKDIQIFHTIIRTLDDKNVVLANGALSNGSVVNHFSEGIIMVEVFFGVSYANNLEKVRKALLDAAKGHKLIEQEGARAPFLGVFALEITGIKMSYRVWTKPETYWDVYFQAHELVKNVCEKEGVQGALPAQMIFLKNEN